MASSYHDIFTSFKTVVETDPDFRQFVLGYLIFDIKTSAGLTVETEFRKCLEEVPVEWKSKLEILEPSRITRNSVFDCAHHLEHDLSLSYAKHKHYAKL